MKPTLKSLVQAELYAVCIEATEQERKRLEVKPQEPVAVPKFSEEKQKEIDNLLNKLGWSSDMRPYYFNIFSILLDAPELKRDDAKKEVKFPLMSVVVFGKDFSSHRYTLNKPYIVSHSSKNHCLDDAGRPDDAYFNAQDKPRLATKLEVKKCIKDLTDAQLRTIMTHPTFGPIMNAVLGEPIETSKVAVPITVPEEGDDE